LLTIPRQLAGEDNVDDLGGGKNTHILNSPGEEESEILTPCVLPHMEDSIKYD